jgi:hypothetical protein
MPEQDAVVAITSGVRDMQAVLNLVWQHLLPAMSPTPLPADPALRERLAQKLASLSLPPQSGRPTSPIAREVSGRRFELPKNDDGIEAIGLETGPRTTLLVRRGGVEGRVPCGSGEWRRGGTLPSQVRVSTGALTGGAEQPVAATGAWTADDTYTARVCQYETPFCSTLKLWFTGRALVLDQEMNVGFGETKRAQLVGRPIAEARAPAAQPKR